jgi:nicotinamidase-related amidase
MGDSLKQVVDKPRMRAGPRDPSSSEFGNGLQGEGDILITKRQWGAFYGTELDLQLRRRGIRTLILGGVATNFGVESTARNAWELGYEICVLEDVTSSISREDHEFSLKNIMVRISRVIPSSSVAFE